MATRAKSTETQTDAPASTVKEAAILRKITIRDVIGDMGDLLSKLIEAGGKTVWLLEVYAQSGRFKIGATDKGEFVKFAGDFFAENLLTGDTYQAGQCILPGFLSDPIAAAMRNDETGEMRSATFAFRIGAHFDKSAATKYVYDAVPIVAPGTKTPAAQLRDSLRAALPAPKPAAEV